MVGNAHSGAICMRPRMVGPARPRYAGRPERVASDQGYWQRAEDYGRRDRSPAALATGRPAGWLAPPAESCPKAAKLTAAGARGAAVRWPDRSGATCKGLRDVSPGAPLAVAVGGLVLAGGTRRHLIVGASSGSGRFAACRSCAVRTARTSRRLRTIASAMITNAARQACGPVISCSRENWPAVVPNEVCVAAQANTIRPPIATSHTARNAAPARAVILPA